MDRVYTVIAVFIAAVAFCEACTSSSGRTPSWDIGDNAEVFPTYDPDSGAVGVGLEIRWRRDAKDSRRELFDMLDESRDGFLDFCEWIHQGGSGKNFAEFVADDDSNGDEMISFDEFPEVQQSNKN